MNILITGASSGIGAASAKQLAKKNDKIFLVYNNGKQACESLADELIKIGANAICIKADISTEQGCKAVSELVRKHTEVLDVLVNAAGGIVKRVKTGEFNWQDFQDVFNLNAFAVFYMCSLCIDLLKASKNAVIVNFTSASIYTGTAGAPLYASAKGAIDVYTRSLARELAPHVRVMTVAPGVVETPFHNGLTSSEMLKSWSDANPLKRNATVKDVAHAVEFCVNNQFMNGMIIDINGGMKGV